MTFLLIYLFGYLLAAPVAIYWVRFYSSSWRIKDATDAGGWVIAITLLWPLVLVSSIVNLLLDLIFYGFMVASERVGRFVTKK